MIVTDILSEMFGYDKYSEITRELCIRGTFCDLATIGRANGPAIVVRVPRSWQGPHIVSYALSFRFWGRTAAGKFQMDVSDIRDVNDW